MGFYVVALRAASALRLPEDELVVVPATIGGLERQVTIRTAYENYGEGKVPRWLWIEVAGQSHSLEAAKTEFQHLGDAMANFLSLSMNAAIEYVYPTVAFDASTDSTEHGYWQFLVPTEQGLPKPARLLYRHLLDEVIAAFESHGDRGSIESALGHYREAMRHILPGEWILALAHAWIGVEALKAPVLERELQKRSMTRAQLAAYWGVKTSQLQNEARLRLLFQNKKRLHERLRTTSNNLEHALTSLGELQSAAQDDALDGVKHLRRAILRLLLGRLPKRFDSPTVDTPFPCASLQRFISATLVGPRDQLAPDDLQYPHFDSTTKPRSVTFADDGHYTMTGDTEFTPRLGRDVVATDIHYSVIGPPGID